MKNATKGGLATSRPSTVRPVRYSLDGSGPSVGRALPASLVVGGLLETSRAAPRLDHRRTPALARLLRTWPLATGRFPLSGRAGVKELLRLQVDGDTAAIACS